MLKAGDCEGAVIQFRLHLLKSPDNPDARAALSTRIAEGLPQLYEDPSPVRVLEDSLLTVSKA